MLVLLRKPSESIIIGEDLLRIKILDVKGPHVKIGIEAPRAIAVNRQEIHEKIMLGKNQSNEANNNKQAE